MPKISGRFQLDIAQPGRATDCSGHRGYLLVLGSNPSVETFFFSCPPNSFFFFGRQTEMTAEKQNSRSLLMFSHYNNWSLVRIRVSRLFLLLPTKLAFFFWTPDRNDGITCTGTSAPRTGTWRLVLERDLQRRMMIFHVHHVLYYTLYRVHIKFILIHDIKKFSPSRHTINSQQVCFIQDPESERVLLY